MRRVMQGLKLEILAMSESPWPGPWGGAKTPRQWPTVSPSPAVPAAGSLRPRRPSPAHLPRLYRSLDGRLGRPNSQHDELHHFGDINTPISASISRLAIDTRSASPFNTGSRTNNNFRILILPDTEAKHMEPAGHPSPVLLRLCSGEADGGCNPGSNYLVVSNINRYLTAIIGPKTDIHCTTHDGRNVL